MSVVRHVRRGFSRRMKKREIFRHVLDRRRRLRSHNARAAPERFPQLRVGIEEKELVAVRDKDKGIDFSFRAQDACRQREVGVRLSDVIRHLPVEETASGHYRLVVTSLDRTDQKQASRFPPLPLVAASEPPENSTPGLRCRRGLLWFRLGVFSGLASAA